MLKIAIVIYPQAEVLDFSGPYEVFATANRLAGGQFCQAFLVSEQGGVVEARGGYQVVANYSFADCPAIDCLLVVGGVHNSQMDNQVFLNWLVEKRQTATQLASVCTGVFLLAQSKLLEHQTVTTHWEDIPELKQLFPTLTVVDNVRWVDQGDFVSSAGISAGIDMSLFLVSKWHSVALAEKTAKQMDFAWTQRGY